MKACSIEGCGRPHEARGWCKQHYMRWWSHGDPLVELATDFVNPLVCVCPEPDADPARDFGMCHNRGCKRKPLALMAVAS